MAGPTDPRRRRPPARRRPRGQPAGGRGRGGPGGHGAGQAGRGLRRGTGDPRRDRAGGGAARPGRLGDAAAGADPGPAVPPRYVERLLAGRLTLGRRRRLLVAAGRLSLELARLHFDAGEREAAEANRDAALRLARQATDAELAAAAVEALAAWALADGRFGDALELARVGQDLAPPASVAALELALDEAQAWASLGDPLAAAGARRQAALTRAMLPGTGLPGPGTAPAAAAAS